MNEFMTLLAGLGMLLTCLGIALLISADGRTHERSLRAARAAAFTRDGGNGRYWE